MKCMYIKRRDSFFIGSSGILVPDSYNKIVDEDGKGKVLTSELGDQRSKLMSISELGVGERGELWSKGRHIMKVRFSH